MKAGFAGIKGMKKFDVTKLMFEGAMIVLKYVLEIAGPYEPKLEYLSTFDEIMNIFHDAGTYSNSNLSFKGHRFPLDKITEAEKTKLVLFFNFVKTCNTFFGNLNGKRKRTMALTARIAEGPEAKYISGSGMTFATRRRVTIFEELTSKFYLSNILLTFEFALLISHFYSFLRYFTRSSSFAKG